MTRPATPIAGKPSEMTVLHFKREGSVHQPKPVRSPSIESIIGSFSDDDDIPVKMTALSLTQPQPAKIPWLLVRHAQNHWNGNRAVFMITANRLDELVNKTAPREPVSLTECFETYLWRLLQMSVPMVCEPSFEDNTYHDPMVLLALVRQLEVQMAIEARRLNCVISLKPNSIGLMVKAYFTSRCEACCQRVISAFTAIKPQIMKKPLKKRFTKLDKMAEQVYSLCNLGFSDKQAGIQFTEAMITRLRAASV